MRRLTKKIEVMEREGVFRVPADLKEGFVLVPCPEGNMNLIFWDEGRLTMFLENYGFVPIIHHSTN